MYIHKDRFHPPFHEYLLRTAHDSEQSKTISTLFNNGNVRFKKYFLYKKQNSDELRSFVQKCHDCELDEMKFLFRFLSDYSEFSFEDQFLLTKALIKKGFYREVADLLGDLLVHNDAKSRFDQLLFLFGDVSQKLGQISDASICFQKAIELKPEYADYHNFYGHSLLKLNKTVQAIKAFQKAIGLSVYYADAHYNLGLAYIQSHYKRKNYLLSKNFPDSAIQSFNKAVELNPSYYISSYITARNYLDQKEWGKAYLYYLNARNKVNFQSEENPIFNFRIALLKNKNLSIKEISNYINKIEKYEKRHPQYPDLLNEKGIVYFFLSKSLSELSSNHFRQALTLNNSYEKAETNLQLVDNDSIGKDLIFRAIKQ